MQRKPGNITAYAVIAGGISGVLLAPVMVIVKYMTGWSIVPEPGWIDTVFPSIAVLFSFGTPVELWVIYGTIYSLALTLMLIGLISLWRTIKGKVNKTQKVSYLILMIGFMMVWSGDAVHTATWHQNGLTTPTPGTNLVANTGYAVHMMGMNLVLIGSLVFGISALTKKLLAPWLAWLFILITPSAPVVSLTLFPTSPSGGLWFFSMIIVLLGYSFLSPRLSYLKAG